MSIVRALTIPPAQTLNSVGTGAADRQIVAAGAGSVPSVVYGEAIVTGRVLNVLAASGGSNLVVQVVWALGPIQSIDLPLYKDRALPGGATVTHYLGTASQTVDSTMVSAMAAQSITYTSALAGIAYSVFVVPISGFDGSLKFTARVRGRLLYDPRKDSTVSGGSGSHRLATPSTWEYSDNPALADADWLRSDVYGCGVSVDWVSVIAAANANDALIGSPAEKRRVIGLEIDSARPVADVSEALRAYAGVWHVHTQASTTAGAVKLVPDADAAAVASYSHASGQILRFGPLQARDISSAPTAVEVVYTDVSKRPTRDAYARASVPGAGSTLPLRLSQVRLPGITRYSQALREATERLNKLRLGDLTAGIEFLDEGIRHEVGDIINITHPVGVTAKPFRISEPPQLVATGRWRAALVEHDPAVYSTTVQTAPSIPDTALVIGGGRPADWVSLENRPANLSALAGTEPIQNTQIAVNGAGQITGIGTGTGTAVANTNVSITAEGALLGAGGGQVSLSSLPGAIAAAQVADGAITTAKFASGIEPVTILPGTTLPTSRITTAIYLTGTGKLYRWEGGAYGFSVPTTDLAGTVADAQIAGLAASKVTGQLSDSQIAAIAAAKVTGQITGTQITDGAISTPKLAAGSVTSAVIAADTITAANIAANAITSAELAAGAVVAGKIAAGTVSASEIAAGAVTTAKIAANAVTANEIAANAVTAGKIAAGAVSATEIAAGAITTAKLAANAVTANEIAANAITTGKIAADAVTAAKIDSRGLTIRDAAGNVIFSAESKFGGNNLIGNSGFMRHNGVDPSGWQQYNNAGISTTRQVAAGGLFGTNYFRITANAPTSSTFGLFVSPGGAERVIDWVPGQTYCISFWARSAGSLLVGASVSGLYSNMGFNPVTILESPTLQNGEWRRWSARVQPASNASTPNGELYITVEGFAVPSGAALDICAVKVEPGEFPTAWSPAPREKVGGDNPITASNATTYIANAAIGSLQVADAAITNAKIANAAIDWAKIGDLNIGTGGGIRSGKTAYGSGTGWLLEYNGGTPRLDIGDSLQYLRWTGTALDVKLNKVTASATTPAGGSFSVSATERNLGTVTVTASGGTPPYTYNWTYTAFVDIQDSTSQGRAAFSSNVATLYATGTTNNTIIVSVSCAVIDSNGLAAFITRSATGLFGTPP